MKKSIIFILFIFSIFISSAFAGEIDDSGVLFNKMKESYNNINSYSYTNYQGEYDTFSKEYQKETEEKYGDLNSQYGDGSSGEVSSQPEYKQGTYQVVFQKSYNISMKIISSDYTPSVLDNAEFIYKPSQDPKNFTVKILGLGFIPLEFKRSITEENSGDFLVMNWTVDLINIEYLFQNGQAAISGKETVDGHSAYVLEFDFSPNLLPSVPSYELGKIPEQAKEKIDYTLGSLGRAHFTKIKYWVDTESFVIIKREQYIGKTLHSTRLFRSIYVYN